MTKPTRSSLPEPAVFKVRSCCGAAGTVALQLRRTAKDGIGRLQASDLFQACRLFGWKCILLQWIVSSIFLKHKYPGRHNKINSLRAAILCKVGVFNSGLRSGEPTNPRNP